MGQELKAPGGLRESVDGPEARLRALGLEVPATKAQGSYVPALVSGATAWVSGQLPLREGQLTVRGSVGVEVSLEEAQEAARVCAANVIAAFRWAAGGLDRLGQVLQVSGYVAATASFREHPRVVNAASEVFTQVFGERGMHTRIAIGVCSLPLGAPVEVAAIIATEGTELACG